MEKVVFGFFAVLSTTLTFGYFAGDISDPHVHDAYELFAAVIVSLIATVLRFGDRTQIGAVHLATSVVAVLHLITAAAVWIWATQASTDGLNAQHTASVVSLAGGALLANLVSVALLLVETATFRRR